jgi:hypothetical protein
MMQHAHVWSVWDQMKKGIWGDDTNNEVHVLTRECHKKFDELLIQAQVTRPSQLAHHNSPRTTRP